MTYRSGIGAVAPDLARLPITFNLRDISLMEGLRAALSTAVIIAASEWLHWPGMIEAAVAALFTCLCDAGGPIRRRLPALLVFSVLGAAMVAIGGTLRGFGLPVALPFAVLGIFCGAMARVYGQSAQQVGSLLCVVVVLSMDRVLPDIAAAATLAAMFLAGGLWATLLTLVLWRVYPFLPARRALAHAYQMLALLAQDLCSLLESGSTDPANWERHARVRRRLVREAIETARVTVLETVRARGPASNRAAQSVIRLETVDQLFGAMIALSDLLETANPAEREMATRMLRRAHPILLALGQSILSEFRGLDSEALVSLAAITADMASLAEDAPVRRVADTIVGLLQIARTLSVPVDLTPGTGLDGARPTLWRRILNPLLANLNWRSLALRHALRAALTAAPAIAFTLIWFTPYDHWLTITIIATMQPYFGNTFSNAMERIGGTLIGGLVAALLGLFVITPLGIAAAMFPLAIIALSVRAVNFGLFMAALTPMVVLLVQLGQIEFGQAGASGWIIVGARALFTIAGGLLAVAGCYFLWPSWEPPRLAAAIAEAIAAHAGYAEAELSLLLGETDTARVDKARRAAGLASNNVEASISRVLLEPRAAGRDRLEAAMAIDAALRRFAGRLSAMQLDPELGAAYEPQTWRRWREWIVASMNALASGNGAIAPSPALAAGPRAEALARIARQIGLMAGAIGRVRE